MDTSSWYVSFNSTQLNFYLLLHAQPEEAVTETRVVIVCRARRGFLVLKLAGARSRREQCPSLAGLLCGRVEVVDGVERVLELGVRDDLGASLDLDEDTYPTTGGLRTTSRNLLY